MKITKMIGLCIVIAAILLAPQVAPQRTAAQDGGGWVPYTDDMLGGGTVKEDARAEGPLPADCPVPEAKDHYVIGMSQANRAEPWREAMDSQIAAAAEDYSDIEVIFQDAAQDNADQVSDVENLLTQGIDLLIISPNEAAPLNEIVREAWESCVPVIVLDRNLVDPNYSMFIGADNVAIGQAAGEYAAKWCADNGHDPCEIAEIRGLEGAPPAKDRGDGFRMGLEAQGMDPDATIIFSQNADWLRERAVPAAAAAFQAYPEVNVLYGHNDPMAEGAYIAAQDAGVDVSSILFVGIDALPTPDGGIMSVLEGRLGVTFVYPTGGRQAIDWAHRILADHVNPPLWEVLPFDTVSPDNAQDVCNAFNCPNAETGTPAPTEEAGEAMAPAAAEGWTMYTADIVDGTVLEGWEYPANGSPLPDGCPAPEAKDHYVIGMSQANRAEPWREAMDSQIAAAAEDYPDVEVIFQDAAQDNADQVSDVENLLTQGIDLLIISPNEAAPLNEIVREAWESCVPVIVLDRNLVDPNYSMFIGADNVAIGKAAGEYVAKWCADNGHDPCEIAEIRGLEGAPPAKDRGDGFRMGLEAGGLDPDAAIIFSQNADWLRERAVPAAAAAFQAYPEVNVLYGHNDPMAEGAYIAAQDAGVDVSSILFVGIDALPTPDGGIMSVLEGRLGVTFVYPTGGRQAIDWAHRILADHIVPPQWVVLPFDTVSPDNAQDVCNTFNCPNAQ
ncbi:MAG TPA: substrate-binding domain-containing protein [Aggregatilinea sp.]|uniref:substrate-binding domain-containing protein n=1 Tax=Aggregatilinea sp. TaxID=2806333 RepID=UPI002BA7D4A8|nr:substrate-binding domain-containing protein [Aggregatilinea sp.]HML21604.1 substrate-binding domain-containing protein [Aggregatilinea sp.]